MATKLLLTMILKDDSELELAKRCLGSFMPYMDGLAVAITGLSKETKQLKALIKRYKGKYIVTSPTTHPSIYSKKKDGYEFSNFAEARNVSFQLAKELQETENYDFWLWADVDDVLQGGDELRKVAAEAKTKNFDAVFFTYWYSVIFDGKGVKDVVIEHLRERLVKPNMFKWISRLHEVLVPIDGNYKPVLSQYEWSKELGQKVVWIHLTDEERVLGAMERNARILELQAKEENRKDPRTLFYLAKTYYDMHQPQYYTLAEQLIYEYLEMSGWPEERSNAWEYVGNIKTIRGDKRGAIDAYFEAIKQFPNRHMPYLLISKEYAELGQHEEASHWLDMALKMEEPKARTTIGNPLQIKMLAAQLKYNDAQRQMKLTDAIYWLGIVNQLSDGQHEGMLETLKEAKLMNDAATWVFNYAKWLKDHGYEEKIQPLLQSLPIDLGREPFAHFIANEYAQPKKWGEKSIVFYASWGAEHFEQWSPKNLQSGIGGSETAVIELAKRWANLGYEVTVFGDPRDDAGEYDGVTYRPYYEINWKDEFNVLILWRSPHLLNKDIKAKKLYMDLHDVASQLDWDEKRMEKIDKVFFKSQFHRKMLPKLPDEKAVIIRNGI